MSRREALVGNPAPSAAPEVSGNSTEAAGPGPRETKDETFSKVKDKFMNELHKIPRELTQHSTVFTWLHLLFA